jgi:hypothetical protein
LGERPPTAATAAPVSEQRSALSHACGRRGAVQVEAAQMEAEYEEALERLQLDYRVKQARHGPACARVLASAPNATLTRCAQALKAATWPVPPCKSPRD